MSLLVIQCMAKVDCNILFTLTQFKLGFLKILEDQVSLKDSLIIWFTIATVLKCCIEKTYFLKRFSTHLNWRNNFKLLSNPVWTCTSISVSYELARIFCNYSWNWGCKIGSRSQTLHSNHFTSKFEQIKLRKSYKMSVQKHKKSQAKPAQEEKCSQNSSCLNNRVK